MEESKRLLIADAIRGIVEQARHGGPVTTLGLMAHGSELGVSEIVEGARRALLINPSLKIVCVGPKPDLTVNTSGMDWIETSDCETDVAQALQDALSNGRINGAVAMHYPFPLGVTTIGRIVTPAKGTPMFIASTTGTSSSDRVEAMLRNAVYGIATAKASGIAHPTVAVLNLDGSGTVLRNLHKLADAGYDVNFGSSARKEGGAILRGNDVVAGSVEVLVCDTLTGNALQKIFSAFTTGGYYESAGWGYGPSVGEGWEKIISIVSRRSGSSVIAEALHYTSTVLEGGLIAKVHEELQSAKKAGFDAILQEIKAKAAPQTEAPIVKPPAVPVNAEIAGVDVLDMDNAAKELWKAGIYAETVMGCTGPMVRVPESKKADSVDILKKTGFL